PNLGLVGTLAWTGNHNDRLAFTFIQDHEPDYNSAGVTPPAGGRVYTSRYLQTLVYSKQFTDRFSWVAQSDLGVQGAAFGPGTRTARWYGLNQYWFYKINESWTWGLGYEWFRDEEGFRVGQVVPSVFNPNGRSSPVPGGFAGNFNQCTFGPQWRPNGSKNLMIRPNCRYDWYGGPTSLNVPGALPYDSGTRSQQFIWGTDISLIY
ncbi:MAG TPA: outer membrane beta-barrel protein, partial [Pirellulales bacterium]